MGGVDDQTWITATRHKRYTAKLCRTRTRIKILRVNIPLALS